MADEQEGKNIAVSLPIETKAERHTNLKPAGLGPVAHAHARAKFRSAIVAQRGVLANPRASRRQIEGSWRS